MDLAQIQLWLAGLGPWGIVIGALLPIAWRWLANKPPKHPTPPGPEPADPKPAPAPGPAPLRDGLLLLLQQLLARRANPAAKGSDPETDELIKLVGAYLKTD